jgi:hypothetical protein
MQISTRPVRFLSLLVLIAVTNVYVFAGGTIAPNASEAGNGKALLGKLITTSNRPILVNGGEAITGTVILSGAQLTTAAASGAFVELPSLGSVMISPSSSVLLTFDAKNVTAEVVSGWASVATVKGVKGAVLDAKGNPVVPGAAAAPAYSRAETLGIAGIAVGGAALIWAIIAWNRANDARDSADAANAAAASLASQLAALRTCLAGQTTSPVKLCTSF